MNISIQVYKYISTSVYKFIIIEAYAYVYVSIYTYVERQREGESLEAPLNEPVLNSGLLPTV